MRPPDVSLVVPVRDEAGNIAPLMAEIRDALDGAGLSWEAFVVDDGSTDGSWPEIVASAAADDRVALGEGAEREEVGGVLHVLENESGGLVDRRDARACCGIRSRARVKRQRVEAGGLVCHYRLPFVVRGGTLARAAGNDNCRDVSAEACA